jgi:hypothetical protein
MVTRTRLTTELKDEIQKRFLAGESSASIATTLSVPFSTVRRFVERNKIGRLRGQVTHKTNDLIVAEVAAMRARTTLELIDPLVARLTNQANEVLNDSNNDMSAKDTLNCLESFLRLRAKLKGEVVQKMEVKTASSEAFHRLMALTDEQFKSFEIPYEEVTPLIE